MAEDEQEGKEEKPYSFVRPGILQSRILNRERQSALGRGLGTLLSSMGPKTQEAEPAPAPLPKLEIRSEETAQTLPVQPAVGVRRTALRSRLQGPQAAEASRGFNALFRAISATAETAAPGVTPAISGQPSATVATGPARVPSLSQERMVTFGSAQFPLAADFLVVMMDVNLIQPNPFVPLSHINREGLDRLTESIKAHGFLRPLVVMPSTLGSVLGGQTYWLVSGERSWQVARLQGIDSVPVRIHEVAPREAIQMVLADDWHIQRLPPMDRARLCGVLRDQMGMTVAEISERLAVAIEEINATLSYLDLEPDVQDSLNNGQISEPAARALLRIEDLDLRGEIWRYTARYQWDPIRIERAVRERLEGRELSRNPSETG